MKLSDIIKPNIEFARSVNIERDHNQRDAIVNYLPTSNALDLIDRFIVAVERKGMNSWSLTGPYGMGKSAFLNYLFALTGPKKSNQTVLAQQKLKNADLNLYKRFINCIEPYGEVKDFIRLPITSAYEPVNRSIARGLADMLNNYSIKGKRSYIATVKELLSNDTIDSSSLINLFREIQTATNKDISIAIDEFGKNLEYMAHHHEDGDIFVLQQLSEMKSVYLWVCLHQAFDEYAAALSAIQRKEWSKVQGRFEDFTFIESPSQMLALLANSLSHSNLGNERLSAWSEDAITSLDATNTYGASYLDKALVRRLYPIHPISALALISICSKYAQNDRTLLSFACSTESYALPSFLKQIDFPEKGHLPSVSLDYLYDYFFNINTVSYASKAETQKWLEINNLINSFGQNSDHEMAILKSIGLLNLLAGSPIMKANANNVSILLEQTAGFDKDETISIIKRLQGKGSLLYREYADEYRLWEGSDFKVFEEIQSQKEKLIIDDLESVLAKYLSLTPQIASRHAHQTGTVRKFERRWLSESAIDESLSAKDGYDGLFVYCFGSSQYLIDVPKQCQDGRPLIIAYLPSQNALHELALEVAAVRKLLEESAELVYDSVARKEVKYRVKVADDNFREYLAQSYNPANPLLQWYSSGEKTNFTNFKQLSSKLSDLCDDCYDKCPPIRNEMVNYNKLSSAASRARRELIEAMFKANNEINLGLEGFGPEVAIYRSLVLSEGLHIQKEYGSDFHITLDVNNAKLLSIWELLDYYLDESDADGMVLSDLISILRAPPYGLKEGPIPIYLSAYLIVRSEEIAIFREGIYRPVINDAEAALMIKRPDLFRLKKYNLSESESNILSAYQSSLNLAKIESSNGLRNVSLLSVVSPLINIFNDMPAYTMNTKMITEEAKKVRLAIQNSHDPAALVFVELPEAVGFSESICDSFNNSDFEQKLSAALTELMNSYSTLEERVQSIALKTFNADNLETLCREQSQRAEKLIHSCNNLELKPFLLSLSRKCEDTHKWLKGVAGLVSGKPMESWHDGDLNGFEIKLLDFADRMAALEAITSLNSDARDSSIRVFSITLADGSTKREVYIENEQTADVDTEVAEILKMPKSKSRAILVKLADQLLEDDEYGE